MTAREFIICALAALWLVCAWELGVITARKLCKKDDLDG